MEEVEAHSSRGNQRAIHTTTKKGFAFPGSTLGKRLHWLTAFSVLPYMIVCLAMPNFRLDYFWTGIELESEHIIQHRIHRLNKKLCGKIEVCEDQLNRAFCEKICNIDDGPPNPAVVETMENIKYLGWCLALYFVGAGILIFVVSQTRDAKLMKRSCLANAVVSSAMGAYAAYAVSSYGGDAQRVALSLSIVVAVALVYAYTKVDPNVPMYSAAQPLLNESSDRCDDDNFEREAKRMLKLAKFMHIACALLVAVSLALFLFAKKFFMTAFLPGLSYKTKEGSQVIFFDFLLLALLAFWYCTNLALVSQSNDSTTLKHSVQASALSWAFSLCMLFILCFNSVAGKLMWVAVTVDLMVILIFVYLCFCTFKMERARAAKLRGEATGKLDIIEAAMQCRDDTIISA